MVVTVMEVDRPVRVIALLVTQVPGVISSEAFNSKGSGDGLCAPWQLVKITSAMHKAVTHEIFEGIRRNNKLLPCVVIVLTCEFTGAIAAVSVVLY